MSGGGRPAAAGPVLEVRDLAVARGHLELVSGVSFALAPGQRVGVIGESGSGKTLTALAAIGLLPPALAASGQVLVKGQDMLAASERARSALRGSAISMIFQEPMTALNPTMRVGAQIAEAVRVHRRVSRAQARARAVELLERVEFTDPRRQARAFPHQLSGGQRQRVMLAMAIACDPAVILADEPTTALDVTVQEQVLALLSRLVDQESAALVLISHDLAVVAGMCERLLVMYGGRVVEAGATREVLTAPRHPYTAALIATSAAVTLESDRSRDVLPVIRGQVPLAGAFPAGCPFRNRCDRASAACASMPLLSGGATPRTPRGMPDEEAAIVSGMASPGGGHEVACWHPLDGVPAGPGEKERGSDAGPAS